eukprot:TRINITY_DN4694_c0_g1_i3.p1 TRINITY_DN4694_c0_g1~~TRINITY_DN4694_c0_g1_i3.p1  ORF type:complete len:105 (-),score=8.14 TRINITY_DN4694_c0_g1_i3:20-334(-)
MFKNEPPQYPTSSSGPGSTTLRLQNRNLLQPPPILPLSRKVLLQLPKPKPTQIIQQLGLLLPQELVGQVDDLLVVLAVLQPELQHLFDLLHTHRYAPLKVLVDG